MPKDALVESAIKNWAPRMITNGIEYSDFVRTTGLIDRWDEWFDRWFETASLHEKFAQRAEAEGYNVSAAQHYITASITYHFGKYLYVHDLDKLKNGSDKTAECYRKAMALWVEPGERLEIEFASKTIFANYRKPTQPFKGLVIIVPGLDSVKEEMHVMQDLFLERGLATIAVDGPGQGESEFNLPIYPDYEKVITAVIDYMSNNIEECRAVNFGLLGISLGGYYVCRGAAFEERVSACVDVAGPFDFGESWDGLPNLTRNAFILRSGASDINDAAEKAKELTLKNCVERIKAPLLVVHGHRDRLFPINHAQRIFSGASGDKLLHDLEDGNHVCNNVPYKYRPLMADWLQEKLS